MPKVSVIIPVYNTESYLEKCLDSVINQTYKNLEIICINDCSTDNSLNILKRYAVKDKRIKLIDLPQNEGVSIARNTGLESAEGKFIAFIDPDDWWEYDLVEKALNKIQNENADIVLFCHSEYTNNKIIPKQEKLKKIKDILKGTNYTKYMLDVSVFIWDKIYKKDLIKDAGIRFTEKIHPTEDVLFTLEIFSKNPAIVFLDECLYNYRLNREGSAMNNYNILVSNQIKAFKIMLNSDFYCRADNCFKQLCIDIVFGGIVYFYVLTTKKKFVLKDFLELRKLVPFMKSNIPAEILEHNTQYKVLEKLTSNNLNNGVSCLK